VIEVSHLTKRYGNNLAVSDLTFTIEKGQIYGFLGPNGAGKSTTMNIMTGCLAATSGDVKIDGYDIFEQPLEAKKRIGYLPELPPLYMDRTPREYLTFVARAKGIAKSAIASQIAHVMEVTQITDVADRLCKFLSKGYRQRVGIAQAILGDPEIIILDEPTVGLDPRQIIEIRNLIRKLGEEHTVLLSSHILSEVQAVCDTILIISKGKLIACDSAENLEKRFSEASHIDLTAEANEEETRSILASVEGLPQITLSSTDEGQTKASFDVSSDVCDEICRNIFKAFAASGKVLLQLAPKTASLEEIFIELTSGKTDQKTAAEEIEMGGEDTTEAAGENEPAAETIESPSDAEPVHEEIDDKKGGEE